MQARGFTEHGLSRRQSALAAGFGLLLMVLLAPVGEFLVLPRLLDPGSIEATIRNVRSHRDL